jgi:hypothetical protein
MPQTVAKLEPQPLSSALKTDKYLKGVWFDHLPDAEIEDFICKEIGKLDSPAAYPTR